MKFIALTDACQEDCIWINADHITAMYLTNTVKYVDGNKMFKQECTRVKTMDTEDGYLVKQTPEEILRIIDGELETGEYEGMVQNG